MNIKKIIAIILAVVAVVMVGVGIYYMNSSKYIFKTALSGMFDYAVEKYDEMTDSMEEFEDFKKFKLTTSNSITTEGVEFANITGDIYANFDDEEAYLNLDSKIMDEDFIGIEGLLEDEKVYFKVKEVLEKFYYTNIDETLTVTEGLKDDEFELLMNYLEKSILADVEDKDLSKSSQTINLNGKNYKTSKVSLKITEKRMFDIIENFLNSIKNDQKVIQILQKYESSITKEGIQELIDMLKETKKSLTNDEIFTLSLYVEGFGGLRRVEISSKEEAVDSVASDVAITLDMFPNSKKQKTYLLSARYGKQVIATFEVEYTSKTDANVVFKMEDIEIKGTLKETKKLFEANLSLIYLGENLGSLSYTETVVSAKKEYKFDLNVNVQDVITITSNNTLFIGENIPKVDVSDALHIEALTEEDSEALEAYITEKIESLGLSNPYEDDDYADEAYSTLWYEEIYADEVEDLMDSEEPMVLWFGSQKCSYCKDFAEVLDDSYFDYDYDIYYIDIDDLTDSDRSTLESLDSRLNVTSTPTVVVMQNGKVKEVKSGAMTKDDYYSFLDSHGIEK